MSAIRTPVEPATPALLTATSRPPNSATAPRPDGEPETFQRARRPEQREARRQAILDVAEAMLAQDPTSEISLREISRRVGLATSNVLRYFDSREAIFLELLARESTRWLDELERELDELEPGSGVAACERVAGI